MIAVSDSFPNFPAPPHPIALPCGVNRPSDRWLYYLHQRATPAIRRGNRLSLLPLSSAAQEPSAETNVHPLVTINLFLVLREPSVKDLIKASRSLKRWVKRAALGERERERDERQALSTELSRLWERCFLLSLYVTAGDMCNSKTLNLRQNTLLMSNFQIFKYLFYLFITWWVCLSMLNGENATTWSQIKSWDLINNYTVLYWLLKYALQENTNSGFLPQNSMFNSISLVYL